MQISHRTSSFRFAARERTRSVVTDRAYAQKLLQREPQTWRAQETTDLKLIARDLVKQYYPDIKRQDWNTLAEDYELALEIYEKIGDLYKQDSLYRQDRIQISEELIRLYQNRLFKPEKVEAHFKKLLQDNNKVKEYIKNQLQIEEKAKFKNESFITVLLTQLFQVSEV